jgi:hypothetical protein
MWFQRGPSPPSPEYAARAGLPLTSKMQPVVVPPRFPPRPPPTPSPVDELTAYGTSLPDGVRKTDIVLYFGERCGLLVTEPMITIIRGKEGRGINNCNTCAMVHFASASDAAVAISKLDDTAMPKAHQTQRWKLANKVALKPLPPPQQPQPPPPPYPPPRQPQPPPFPPPRALVARLQEYQRLQEQHRQMQHQQQQQHEERQRQQQAQLDEAAAAAAAAAVCSPYASITEEQQQEELQQSVRRTHQ